jgi:UDP-glucose 4-epimerase
VVDLAEAHLAALRLTEAMRGARAYNVGTGHGYSVLEIIRAFEVVSQREIPFVVTDRRPGDVAKSLANPSLARNHMGWQALRGLDDMCRDSWAWQKEHGR